MLDLLQVIFDAFWNVFGYDVVTEASERVDEHADDSRTRGCIVAICDVGVVVCLGVAVWRFLVDDHALGFVFGGAMVLMIVVTIVARKITFSA